MRIDLSKVDSLTSRGLKLPGCTSRVPLPRPCAAPSRPLRRGGHRSPPDGQDDAGPRGARRRVRARLAGGSRRPGRGARGSARLPRRAPCAAGLRRDPARARAPLLPEDPHRRRPAARPVDPDRLAELPAHGARVAEPRGPRRHPAPLRAERVRALPRTALEHRRRAAPGFLPRAALEPRGRPAAVDGELLPDVPRARRPPARASRGPPDLRELPAALRLAQRPAPAPRGARPGRRCRGHHRPPLDLGARGERRRAAPGALRALHHQASRQVPEALHAGQRPGGLPHRPPRRRAALERPHEGRLLRSRRDGRDHQGLRERRRPSAPVVLPLERRPRGRLRPRAGRPPARIRVQGERDPDAAHGGAAAALARPGGEGRRDLLARLRCRAPLGARGGRRGAPLGGRSGKSACRSWEGHRAARRPEAPPRGNVARNSSTCRTSIPSTT